MSTPDRQLRTLFVLDAQGRIVSRREPGSGPGPKFSLIRGTTSRAWAVRSDVPHDVATELDALAKSEPAPRDLQEEPVHADRYASLVGGQLFSGPAFEFPETLVDPGELTLVNDIRQLERHLEGWTADEIPGRSPIFAIVDDGHAVSTCCCARQSEDAAEAGVETAADYRGRGYAATVTAAWALAIRASGRIPLYSTSWDNTASLAVARKLGLIAYASDWSLSD
ncbi:MAG: GNAT family N-acetyltransferase [SAR202 cluster bacterium]|jgi:RimJ/RimL family protein N-acetyltransferase|nr:GNAT family N-acetyltransferase [Chloroflexota bacterium]MDP6420403.1 GNAT family N-acetyltransferase [SAR202 cluster bacterium]MDP6662806.1 GNAT family N-acetyltransferase [SAR202 cluster bacterium]MDP6800199.1 GNAT family N-acetyltransferase [SAR202 cluster bacterium]MQG70504.1 GNAT family N-acetyltransferase [SAR202 cluster bacterium]|tara:strand:- start:891 stop:1562 length:672 start_codon:yes stop_codon:yes gene_type:complete